MKHKKNCGLLLILPNFSHNFKIIVRLSIKNSRIFWKTQGIWKKTQGFWLKNQPTLGRSLHLDTQKVVKNTTWTVYLWRMRGHRFALLTNHIIFSTKKNQSNKCVSGHTWPCTSGSPRPAACTLVFPAAWRSTGTGPWSETSTKAPL